MWNLFFNDPKCVLGTLSPHEVVHNFFTIVTHVTCPKYIFKNKIRNIIQSILFIQMIKLIIPDIRKIQ